MSYQEELKLQLAYEGEKSRETLLNTDSNTRKTCLYHRENCVYIGYAQYPDYGLRATIGCYDYSCKIYIQDKLDHGGIESRPSSQMRQPEWKQQLAATA